MIAYWIQVGNLLGYSRSVGEIFGLIFVSEAPLNADDIVDRLQVSRSGVGQGLKALQEIGAIKPVHLPANRKEHFQMQTDLGVLVKQLLSSRIFLPLEELGRQKQTLAEITHMINAPHLQQRFEKLQRWEDKAAPVMAILKALA